MDPAHAEADAGRPEPVGERHEPRLAAARDDDPVHLRPFDEPLQDRLPGRRLGQRRVEVRFEVSRRVDAEDPSLPARVDRLQDRRQADRVDRRASLREAPHGRERRLGDALLGEDPAHRDLVGHPVGHVAADGGESETLGDRGDDGHRPVGRHGQRAGDAVPPRDVLDGVHVREIDDLRYVRHPEPGSVRVAVDRDHAEAALPRLEDRAPLMTPSPRQRGRSTRRDARWSRIERRLWSERREVGALP